MSATQEKILLALREKLSPEACAKTVEILHADRHKEKGSCMKIEAAVFYLLKKVDLQVVLLEAGLYEIPLDYVHAHLSTVEISQSTKAAVFSDVEASLGNVLAYISREICESQYHYARSRCSIHDSEAYKAMFSSAVKYHGIQRGTGLLVDHLVSQIALITPSAEYAAAEVLPLEQLYDAMEGGSIEQFVVQQLDVMHCMLSTEANFEYGERIRADLLRNAKSIRHHWGKIVGTEALGQSLDWCKSVISAYMDGETAEYSFARPSQKRGRVDSGEVASLHRDFAYDMNMILYGHSVRHGMSVASRARCKENASEALHCAEASKRKAFFYSAIARLVGAVSSIFIGVSFALLINRSLIESIDPVKGKAGTARQLELAQPMLLALAMGFNGLVLQKQVFADSKKSFSEILSREINRVVSKVVLLGLLFTAIFYVDPAIYALREAKAAVLCVCGVGAVLSVADPFLRPRYTFSLFDRRTFVHTAIFMLSIAIVAYSVQEYTHKAIGISMQGAYAPH
ncbi:uncharacterized protein NEMAJ01_1472 [Nematocida major]|uniref:uncharacterized protein n=1 Tax=Nematocida major TaxID=1912982 RepID=UPI0020073AA2|nr:uncharacterized protein NEMAJ01_1472 [Nematocida major]KAH9386576.1 hypothetical protein NEMAJ01_1472 [Nematocida major]